MAALCNTWKEHHSALDKDPINSGVHKPPPPGRLIILNRHILVFEGVKMKIIQGLKQGDPLSVPLFIVNMEPLIRCVQEVATGVQVGIVRQKWMM